MAEINWKSKYEALKAKFMESVDTAFRLGYEQGQNDAAVENVQQQQQQQAEQEMANAQAAGMQGDEQDPNAQQDPSQAEQAPDSAHPGGSELDQHISQLESMLGKGEIDMTSMMKSIAEMRKIQKKIVFESELKKSAQAIPEIAKNLHKPKFKISAQANHNLTSNAKKAVNMQEKIVSDIMAKWEEESKASAKSILDVIKVEGLTKKD